jgi:hypothetical protein
MIKKFSFFLSQIVFHIIFHIICKNKKQFSLQNKDYNLIINIFQWFFQ